MKIKIPPHIALILIKGVLKAMMRKSRTLGAIGDLLNMHEYHTVHTWKRVQGHTWYDLLGDGYIYSPPSAALRYILQRVDYD